MEKKINFTEKSIKYFILQIIIIIIIDTTKNNNLVIILIIRIYNNLELNSLNTI